MTTIQPADKTIEKYNFILAYLLTRAGIQFYYNVDRGIDSNDKQKNHLITFEVLFDYQTVFVEIVETADDRKIYDIKTHLHEMHCNIECCFLKLGMPYKNFYEGVAEWLYSYSSRVSYIASFEVFRKDARKALLNY
jgi:hypothetical protein